MSIEETIPAGADSGHIPSLLDGLTYSGDGGHFDFIPHALLNLTKSQVSWRISDHYPLWLEFVTA